MIANLIISMICGIGACVFSVLALDGGFLMALLGYVLGQWVGFAGMIGLTLFRQSARRPKMAGVQRNAI